MSLADDSSIRSRVALGGILRFGHAKRRLGGIWRDGFEELNWVAPYDRLLPLGERPTQLRQGDILQLPDPLSGHSEFLSNFFENFRFAVVQPESHQTSARLIDCLIHQAPYVLNLPPFAGSKRSTAFIRPMFPSEIKSRSGSPKFA